MERKINLLFVLAAVLMVGLPGCEKQENEAPLTTGYVIGFDQCTTGLPYNSGKGFVLTANNYRDTLMTYNLPDSLYDFPGYLFAEGLYSPLFPDSARNKYKMTFSYRIAREDERKGKFVICRGDIYNPKWYNGYEIVVTRITDFTLTK